MRKRKRFEKEPHDELARHMGLENLGGPDIKAGINLEGGGEKWLGGGGDLGMKKLGSRGACYRWEGKAKYLR